MQPCGGADIVSDECVEYAVGKISSTMSSNSSNVCLYRPNVPLYLDISVCPIVYIIAALFDRRG